MAAVCGFVLLSACGPRDAYELRGLLESSPHLPQPDHIDVHCGAGRVDLVAVSEIISQAEWMAVKGNGDVLGSVGLGERIAREGGVIGYWNAPVHVPKPPEIEEFYRLHHGDPAGLRITAFAIARTPTFLNPRAGDPSNGWGPARTIYVEMYAPPTRSRFGRPHPPHGGWQYFLTASTQSPCV
jgi:hypothetical protein